MVIRSFRRHPLAAFLVGSVALGSVVTAAAQRLPGGAALLPAVAIPVSYIPATVAVLVVRRGTREDRAAFRRRVTTLRVGWKSYAVALGVLPLAHVGGVGLATLTRGKFPLHPGRLALLPLFIVTSIGEEVGWRGYAVPRLQERYGLFVAAVTVGLAWAAFHWVALLANPDSPLAYVAVSTLLLTAMSVIITYVFDDARQAVVIAVLMHAIYDTVSVGMVPLVETGVPLLAFALSAGVAWAIAIAVVAGPRLLGLHSAVRGT